MQEFFLGKQMFSLVNFISLCFYFPIFYYDDSLFFLFEYNIFFSSLFFLFNIIRVSIKKFI
jgi:hypothetical protein